VGLTDMMILMDHHPECCLWGMPAADGISLAPEEAAGFFRVGQYGQVHTLETRVNELLLRVSV